MQLRKPDGIEEFAWVWLIMKVTQRDGIVVDAERLKLDDLQKCMIHDQEVRIKLAASSATVLRRPRAGAREGEPSAWQRMEIHADPIFRVRDQSPM
jgi:hypothetical protein